MKSFYHYQRQDSMSFGVKTPFDKYKLPSTVRYCCCPLINKGTIALLCPIWRHPTHLLLSWLYGVQAEQWANRACLFSRGTCSNWLRIRLDFATICLLCCLLKACCSASLERRFCLDIGSRIGRGGSSKANPGAGRSICQWGWKSNGGKASIEY